MKDVPPIIATWMLRHLVLGDRNEALEGDLLEEFQRRHSATWYWRQVLGAIVDFSNLLRAGWLTTCAVVFAAIWVYGLCLISAFSAHSPMRTATGNWIPLSYGNPITTLVGIVFYLAVPLSLYLALAQSLSLRTFRIGLGVGMLVIIAVPFVQSCLATPLNYFLEYLRTGHWNVLPWLRSFDLMQGLAPLLAAIWAASLSKIKMGTPGP